MKKFLVLMLVLLMVVVSACAPVAEETTAPEEAAPVEEGAETEEAAVSGQGTIAVCLPALDNPLMLEISDTFTQTFGDTYNVEIASADGNPNTQATQVQNFIAMDVDFIFAMAVESTSLAPVLEEARAAGILVMVAGGEPGENARDAVMKMDQFLAGEYAAYMACQWVEATYPDAAPGSVETVALISTLNTEALARTNGLLMISEPYLKNEFGEYITADGTPISDADGAYLSGYSEADRVANPAFCPSVNIVASTEAQMFQAGQTAMQNFLTTNPNVRLVLAYASDGGVGASQAIVDEFNRGAASVIPDLSQVAVFGVGMFGPEADAIAASSLGEGVFRGAVAFGGGPGELPRTTSALAQAMLNGEDYPEITWDALALVTSANGELVIQPAANSGVIALP